MDRSIVTHITTQIQICKAYGPNNVAQSCFGGAADLFCVVGILCLTGSFSKQFNLAFLSSIVSTLKNVFHPLAFTPTRSILSLFSFFQFLSLSHPSLLCQPFPFSPLLSSFDLLSLLTNQNKHKRLNSHLVNLQQNRAQWQWKYVLSRGKYSNITVIHT